MHWNEVRDRYPNAWLVIEALDARTVERKRLVRSMAVHATCESDASVMRTYRDLQRQHPNRELYFVHTANEELDIEERSWTGIRQNDAPQSPR